MRYLDGRLVYTSELFKRHQDRSFRDCGSRDCSFRDRGSRDRGFRDRGFRDCGSREELHQLPPMEKPGRSIHDPKILRLYQECMDCAPRQGLSQLTSSDYPFGLATSEEFWLCRPLSRPLSSGSSIGEEVIEY